jgi:hypothetical protein
MKDFSLSQFKAFEDKDAGKWNPHVRRDWAIIVCANIIGILFFVSFHSYLYFLMMTDNYFSGTDISLNNAPEKVRQKDLDAVLSAFQKKKENFEAILAEPTLLQDPSIEKTKSPVEGVDIQTAPKTVDLSH